MSENHHNGNAPDMQDTATDSQGKDGMKWQVLEREYLFRRPWLTVRRDKVRLPNGNINPEFYVLEYPDWVNVIALTEDGHIVMERQYRHGIGSTGWEIPAGVCEPGESPEQSARRELYEETGYSGGTWIPNLTSTPNASTSNNRCHSFIATGVKKHQTSIWKRRKTSPCTYLLKKRYTGSCSTEKSARPQCSARSGNILQKKT